MLGRQQIAGIATAISELFKNAYDAYADNVEVDFFKSDGLFVLRDDGYGMTAAEFEGRWLTIGTESKLDTEHELGLPYIPQDKVARSIMGEKGIGRLAIALIGRQVLVLTRAKREDGLHDLVGAYIHWGLFTIPGINLEEIEIPVRTFSNGKLPSQKDIARLIDQLKANVKYLWDNHHDNNEFPTILEELETVCIDPIDIDDFLDGLSLSGSGHGTHFYIMPADENLEAEVEAEKRSEERNFTKFLIGFSNQTFTSDEESVLNTAFRYWESDRNYEDLIESNEFFTKDELLNADHHLKGRFDDYGQFSGEVRIYDADPVDHIVSWKEGAGKKTLCGPFKIEFGYVQGNRRETKMPPDEWRALSDKTSLIGGLYVYRNGLRVLPYGLSDFDWLDIELRRNKGAGYYFFSYRRVFGAVKIDKVDNNKLVEKAGREGFQHNKAFRQFREILINFFIQLAADFFRSNANISTLYDDKKREYTRIELARQKKERQATTKRKNFSELLDKFFQRTNESLVDIEVVQLDNWIKRKMYSAGQIKDPDKAAQALLDAELGANQKLSKISESYRVTKPRGVGLTKQLRRDWEAYVNEYSRLETEVFGPAAERITETIGNVAREAQIYVDQRRRLKAILDNVVHKTRTIMNKEVQDTNRTATETRKKVLDIARNAIAEMNQTIEKVTAEFSRQNLAEMATESIEKLRGDMEADIASVARRNRDILEHVRNQLADAVAFETDEAGEFITNIEMDEAIDEELLALREQADLDADLAQLGMTIGIINHEFDSAIKTIRKGVRELKGWARANDELEPLYRKIRTSFDHLDNFLNLFTPLQRRMYREPIEIVGYQIEKFIQELFENRLERHNITLKATKDFQEKILIGYPSTFFPVFVNIIDNAIFWMRNESGRREIFLDANRSSYSIKNSGPKIHARDQDAIFEQGFTRKPGGRGLGLFIAKNVLRKEGFDLSLGPTDDEFTVNFVIDSREPR